MKILILFAHPAFHKSKVNKVLVEGLSDIPAVTFHDLYQEYPELDIDVMKEQELLSTHDIIVFQFPLFWYSTPAILKEWQDLVLEHGWAYGSKGDALKDKLFLCVLTTGGHISGYRNGDFHNHTINQLLSPIRQTAILCKMRPLPPFVVHSTHAIEKSEVLHYKKDLLKLIERLKSNQIDPEEVGSFEFINEYITHLN